MLVLYDLGVCDATHLCVPLTFTFNQFADTFIQRDLQMRTMESIKPIKEQQYVTIVTNSLTQYMHT